jgi:hypothetical protein
MTPLRRMILQFSQSFLTDARTFIFKSFLLQPKYALATNRKASTAALLFVQARH